MKVFPACAGVIPATLLISGNRVSFPRMRGGDPMLEFPIGLFIQFSPHARG